jgi:hypothetical protein
MHFRGAGQIEFDSAIFFRDSFPIKQINFTPDSAARYLQQLIESKKLWKEDSDSVKNLLTGLIDHYETPFDTIRHQLQGIDFSGMEFDTTLLVNRDTLPLRWLNDTLLYVDTNQLERSPYYAQKTIVFTSIKPDSNLIKLMDSIPDVSQWIDSLLSVKDTLIERYIDFDYLESKNIRLHRLKDKKVTPPFINNAPHKQVKFSADSGNLIITEFSRVLMARDDTPFLYLPGGNMKDSLQTAVNTLLDHTWARDSIQLFLSDNKNRRTPFWLSNRNQDLYRYWIRNSQDDSITVWLGNPSKYNISMFLEERVKFKRLGIIPADDITFTTSLPDLNPLALKPRKEIPDYWDLSFAGSFSINQNYITYWAQGGESSFAGLIDIIGKANYTNTERKTNWESSGRMKFGAVNTKEKGLRISTDIIEVNSQFNKIITNKLDFSSSFYFRTQIAKGYNYPNDSVPISKFLNPGTYTIGIGGEYKPFDHTLINFSPLSYKNTFVLDTADIDQTVHGVEAGKKSKQEIGGQLVIKNNLTLLDDFKVANTLRLFSNYANNPQNVDVDWEMTLERRISWIFSIRLNIHLIYDDDIRFPIEQADGTEIKVPRTQFNQLLGLSVSLNL